MNKNLCNLKNKKCFNCGYPLPQNNILNSLFCVEHFLCSYQDTCNIYNFLCFIKRTIL